MSQIIKIQVFFYLTINSYRLIPIDIISKMAIPGLTELTDGEENVSPTLLLLSGPPGIGKRDYCREFLEGRTSNPKKMCLYFFQNYR